jgi:flotillin
MFGLPVDVVVGAGLGVLVLLMVMIVVARMYRKAGPHEALIVYGMGGTHVYTGRGTIIFPMVQTCKDLSLELMSFDVAPQQNLYTNQGVAVTVEAVAQIKVKSDTESILTAAEQFLTKRPEQREALIRLVMEGHLRGIMGQLTVEQIVKEPEMVGDRMRSTCADDMSKMGLEVVSFTIKEVRDKNEYITNMGRPDVARIKRDAEVATAEADRDIAIKRAEMSRAAAVAKAQADQERVAAETASLAKQAEAQRDLNIKQAAYLEATKKAHAQADLRNRNQHPAAASDHGSGTRAAGGARSAGEGARSGNRAPRTRTDCHGTESGGRRAAAHPDARGSRTPAPNQ